MQNFKNIIFDLGGVLIDWNPRYLLRKVFKDEAEMEYFLTYICNDDWNAKQDAGQTIAEAYQELSSLHPDKAHLIKTYHDRWPETLGGEITGTVKILEKLKNNNLNLFALTNWSHETFPYAKKHFTFLNHFLDIVVSGTEKVIKPDHRIYEILLTRNNLNAHESVFIDDRPINVEAAENIGITGIHFTSAENLELTLKQLGVL